MGLTAAEQAGAYYARRRNKSATLRDDLAQRAYGSIAFHSNVAQSITLGGSVVNLALGADLAHTLASLLATLNDPSPADPNISQATYELENSTLIVRAKAPGVATMTLAASSGTASGSHLKLVKSRQRVVL